MHLHTCTCTAALCTCRARRDARAPVEGGSVEWLSGGQRGIESKGRAPMTRPTTPARRTLLPGQVARARDVTPSRSSLTATLPTYAAHTGRAPSSVQEEAGKGILGKGGSREEGDRDSKQSGIRPSSPFRLALLLFRIGKSLAASSTLGLNLGRGMTTVMHQKSIPLHRPVVRQETVAHL